MTARPWKFTLPIQSIFHNDEMGLDEKADKIATLLELKLKVWGPTFERPSHEEELALIADEMRDAGKAGDVEWFDGCMGGLYDIADFERIWVKTF